MERYYKLSKYLKERFGGRVQRVTLEGGFTCPNIDGTKAAGGCTFCTDDGSSSGAQNGADNISNQLAQGIKEQGQRFRTDKFIAYLQSFTNTYADVDYLRSIYDQAVAHPSVKVLAIGTRPDCVPDEVIKLFEEYTSGKYLERLEKLNPALTEEIRKNNIATNSDLVETETCKKEGLELWVDIGVQTSHNITQERINRAHTYEDFVDAANRLKACQNPLLRVCTHVILGLPGETKEMILETADKLAEAPIDDLKIHQLCILEGTPLSIDYFNNALDALQFKDEEYIEILADFISRLPKHIVLQRLMAEAKEKELIAPMWADRGRKQRFLEKFHDYLELHNLSQGDKYKDLIVL